MLRIRPQIFLFVLLAMLGLLTACNRAEQPSAAEAALGPAGGTASATAHAGGASADEATAGPRPAPAATGEATADAPPPPQTASAEDVARLIRRLNQEQIVPGEVAAGSQFFPGEFDRYQCLAVEELLKVDTQAAAAALRRVLDDSDPIVRRNAAIALARMGDASGSGILYELLDDDRQNGLIAAVMVEALAGLARRDDTPPLAWDRLHNVFQRRLALNQRCRHLPAAILRSADAADDQPAARRLVLANLDSRDPALRHAALSAAGRLQWPDELPAAVLRAMQDDHPRIVLEAVAALTAHGWADRAAIGARLAEIVRHPDARVRQATITAIAQLNPPGGQRILLERLEDMDLQVQRAAVGAMATMGDLEGLRAALAVRRFRIRLAAAEALADVGPQALPLLEQASGDDSFNVRRAVAESIASIGDVRGAAIVLPLLEDRAVSVRMAARNAYESLTGRQLLNYQPQQGPQANAQAIEEARSYVAAQSPKWAAGGRVPAPTIDEPHAEAVDLLLRGLALPPGDDRTLAAETLATLGSAAVPAVESRLNEHPPAVQRLVLTQILPQMDEAYAALGLLWQAEGEAVTRRRAALRLAEASRKRSLPAVAIEHMVQVLHKEHDPVIRRLLGERLLSLRPEGFAAAAAVGLGLEDAQSRQLAANWMATLRYAPAYNQLVALLSDEAQQVRQAAADALGSIGDRRAADVLREKLVAARPVTDRLAYGSALARLGDVTGRDELIRLLAETDETVRTKVMEAMGEAGDRAFIAPLIDRLGEGNIIQTAVAIESLEQITGLAMGQARGPLSERRETINRWRKWFQDQEKTRPQ